MGSEAKKVGETGPFVLSVSIQTSPTMSAVWYEPELLSVGRPSSLLLRARGYEQALAPSTPSGSD